VIKILETIKNGRRSEIPLANRPSLYTVLLTVRTATGVCWSKPGPLENGRIILRLIFKKYYGI
jgi:hypothetical protein